MIVEQNDGAIALEYTGGKVTGRIALGQETLEELKVARGKSSTKVGLNWPRVLSSAFQCSQVVDSILSLSLPCKHSWERGKKGRNRKGKEKNGISEGSD